MNRLLSATVVCATLLGMCSLCAETGEGASAGERNVWTLSDGYLQKDGCLQEDGWKIKASWTPSTKTLSLGGENCVVKGSGILDWDDLILKIGEEEIEDLDVQVTVKAFANTVPITEFRCDRAIFEASAFRSNKNLLSVRAGGLRQTTLPARCFADCTSLTNVVFDFPNMTEGPGDYVFSDCKSLKADVMDILNPGITAIGEHSFGGNSGIAGLTGTLTLTNIHTLGKWGFQRSGLTKLYLAGPLELIPNAAFFGCTSLQEATFDLAPDAYVEPTAFGDKGGGRAPLARIRFLRKPFDAVSMTNLFAASSGKENIYPLTAENALVIGLSRSQWPKEEREACAWWKPATKEGGLSDEELAAKPQGCLGIAEIQFPDFSGTTTKTRRAWIVHERSPHDKGGFCVLIR